MTTKGYKKSRFSLAGAIIFFFTIALVIQIAILTYDYIIERTNDNLLIAVLMLIVVIMLAAVCTVADLIRRKIMVDRPVRAILEATDEIAHGDFSVRVVPRHVYGKYDEYDLIIENLNTMTAELEKSEMLKNDFTSNVSHELKTPISVIKSYSSKMCEGGLDEETYRSYAQTVSSASSRLSDLITNILRLTKLENQRMALTYERVNLCAQLSDALVGYENLIEEKELELECELDDVYVTSVPSYLEIVWNNLISNAIKFTDRGGKITVSLKKENGSAKISVSDTGCGISREVGERIFEKFYQGDTSHSMQGNGLGLALVKKVIDLVGGEISVSSKVGEGTTFTITLGCLDS